MYVIGVRDENKTYTPLHTFLSKEEALAKLVFLVCTQLDDNGNLYIRKVDVDLSEKQSRDALPKKNNDFAAGYPSPCNDSQSNCLFLPTPLKSSSPFVPNTEHVEYASPFSPDELAAKCSPITTKPLYTKICNASQLDDSLKRFIADTQGDNSSPQQYEILPKPLYTKNYGDASQLDDSLKRFIADRQGDNSSPQQNYNELSEYEILRNGHI